MMSQQRRSWENNREMLRLIYIELEELVDSERMDWHSPFGIEIRIRST